MLCELTFVRKCFVLAQNIRIGKYYNIIFAMTFLIFAITFLISLVKHFKGSIKVTSSDNYVDNL